MISYQKLVFNLYFLKIFFLNIILVLNNQKIILNGIGNAIRFSLI